MMFLQWIFDPTRLFWGAGQQSTSQIGAGVPPPVAFANRWATTEDGHHTFTLDSLRFTIVRSRQGWRYTVEALDHNDAGSYAESRLYMTEQAAKVGALKEYLRRTAEPPAG